MLNLNSHTENYTIYNYALEKLIKNEKKNLGFHG